MYMWTIVCFVFFLNLLLRLSPIAYARPRGRINNPTGRELEKTIALLENGYDGIATSSGMGAVNVVYMTFLGAGKRTA